MRWVIKLVVLATFLVTNTLAVPPSVPLAPKEQRITRDDICMAWVIDNEARGEPLLGQRAVYDVVKHRMALRNLTVCEVVKEPYQFSGYHSGMRMRATEIMLTRLNKVRKMKPVVPNAVGFHNNTVHPTWADRLRKVTTIGKHAFYAFRKPAKEKQK